MKRWFMALVLGVSLGAGGWLVEPWLHGQQTQAPQSATLVNRDPTSFRDVVKHVLPAVVSIETHAKPGVTATRANPQLFDDPNLPEEFRKFLPEEFRRGPMNPTQPNEPNRLGFGSGFFVDPSGVIVTNYHVLEGADSATVRLQDGRKFTAKTMKLDRRTDLAVLVLETKEKNFPYLEFGDSDAMEIGDRVLAVGAPFGLAGSVTHGIVSAKGRNGMHMNMYEDFLQTDAAINPGNSGGPLVNLEGKVVGINAAIKSRSGGFQGVGLAVASNLAKNVVHALRTDGVVHRGYLGVQIRELDPEVATRLGVAKGTGVVVAQVFDNTPAAKAGMKAGDIITDIAGRKIKDGKVLQNLVASLPLNQKAPVEVLRDGKKVTLDVKVEDQPIEYGTSAAPAPRQHPTATNSATVDSFGIEVSDLTDTLADDLGFAKGTQGVVVTRVQNNSVAANAGIRRGMLITKVGSQTVTDKASAAQALQKANLSQGVVLQVATPQGGVNYLFVRSGSGS